VGTQVVRTDFEVVADQNGDQFASARAWWIQISETVLIIWLRRPNEARQILREQRRILRKGAVSPENEREQENTADEADQQDPE
jgi:hypothetical protein